MFAETVMTAEEQEQLVKKIWTETQDKIKDNIDSAIRSELLAHMGSMSARVVRGEMKSLIEAEMKNRQDELKEVATKAIDKVMKQFNDMVVATIRYEFERIAYDTFSDNFASSLRSKIIDNIRNIKVQG